MCSVREASVRGCWMASRYIGHRVQRGQGAECQGKQEKEELREKKEEKEVEEEEEEKLQVEEM